MTVWSKALSLFFWFMTPCGVSTGILSFGGGIVVGALGGGRGILGVLVELAFLGLLFFFFFFFFFLSLFSLFPPFSPFSLGYGIGTLVASYFSLHFTWLLSHAQM